MTIEQRVRRARLFGGLSMAAFALLAIGGAIGLLREPRLLAGVMLFSGVVGFGAQLVLARTYYGEEAIRARFGRPEARGER